MACEWVGPVTALLAGVAGMSYTYYTAKRAREQASTDLKEQLGHERLQAREEREQKRLESAYLEMLKMAERVGQWAQFVEDVAETEPPTVSEFKIPTLEAQADTAALMAAFGTNGVRAKFDAWENVVKQMITQAKTADFEERNPADRSERDPKRSPRAVFRELRPKEKVEREALQNEVRAELGLTGVAVHGDEVGPVAGQVMVSRNR